VSEKIVQFVQHVFPTGNTADQEVQQLFSVAPHSPQRRMPRSKAASAAGWIPAIRVRGDEEHRKAAKEHSPTVARRPGDDGSYKDLHSSLSATIGMEGCLFIAEQMQNGKTGWSERANVQTQLLFLLQLSGGLRFNAVGGTIRIHMFHIKRPYCSVV
jgi:hypothetical protein